MMRNKFSSALMLVALAAMLTGCQAKKEGDNIQNEEALVHKSVKSLKAKRYSSALDPLRKLNQDYTTSPNAQGYRLELISAEYQAGEYENAAATANQFIVMYPHEKYVDYALYMKSLSLYSSYGDWSPVKLKFSLPGKDPKPLHEADQALEILIKKFPTSRYFYQATKLQATIRESIAQRDFDIANHYFARHAYLASLERLNLVIETSQNDSLIKNSLKLMQQNYSKLHVNDMQAKMEALIAAN